MCAMPAEAVFIGRIGDIMVENIPMGDDGFVPEQAIQNRYRDYCRKNRAEYDDNRIATAASG